MLVLLLSHIFILSIPIVANGPNGNIMRADLTEPINRLIQNKMSTGNFFHIVKNHPSLKNEDGSKRLPIFYRFGKTIIKAV